MLKDTVSEGRSLHKEIHTFTVASRVSHPAGTVVSKLIFMTSSRVKARINVTLLGFYLERNINKCSITAQITV